MTQMRNRLSEKEWNVKELMERLEGDQEFLRELLQMFREDSQANLKKARAAMAAGDLQELSRTEHALKGVLKNLSMNATAETAAARDRGAK
jgi:two-component system, sensor histidine kinase and response regulator